MDNPAFQNDNGVITRPKRSLTRTDSTLTPTNKSWHLTQVSRPQLCRCNSVLVPQSCCADDTDNNLDGPASLEYPFFAKKSSVEKIRRDNSLWNKEVWSENYNRLHDSRLVFQKLSSSKPGVSTIYDPQFLSSKFNYSGSHHTIENKEMKKEWWPWDRKNLTPSQKVSALLCAFLLTLLLVSWNILYILKTVRNSADNQSKIPWVDVVLVNGEFRITNEPYKPTLANHSSDDFQHLSRTISHQLDSLFLLSVVSEPYHSTAVTQLLPGLVVRCQLVLRSTTQFTATRIGLAFIGGLRNQHGHVWLGNFSVDIQSIGFQASADAVTWSGWSRWSECEHTQDFGNVQLRSRNCTLRSGQFLYSTLPCLLVQHSHRNIETSPCPPTSADSSQLQPEPLEMAESNIHLSHTNNVSTHSERVISEIKVTKEDCNTKNKTMGSIIRNSLNATTNTELPIKSFSVPCSCAQGQVCVALQDQLVPKCLPVLDTTDPTGCAGHCKINTQLCQKIQENAFRCVDDSKCLEDEWQCGNKLCIPLSKRCDGHFNCYDHTDEYNCDCLGAEQFTCNDSQCIPNHRFCDGFPDCKDHSDEPFGCGGECKSHEWKCNNSRCIPQSKLCDKEDYCGDSSDEAECPIVSPE